MKSNLVGAVVAAVALVALAMPHGSAAAEPVRSSAEVTSAGDPAESAERVDNLRLQRIASGSMRGRLVVAGSLDHLPDEGVVHDVVVRMTMTVPRGDGRSRTVGRKVLDYRLPAGVSPQNMTLRWLLSARETRIVDRAGDEAQVSVLVGESRAAGPLVMHRKEVDELRIEPLRALPSYGRSLRGKAQPVFIPAGLYQFWQTDPQAQLPEGTYWVTTSEDRSGAPYVSGAGFNGTDWNTVWFAQPAWDWFSLGSGSPGPGEGYIYMRRPDTLDPVPTLSWSLLSTWSDYPTVSLNGSFSNDGTKAWMNWNGIFYDGEYDGVNYERVFGDQNSGLVFLVKAASPGAGSVSGMTPPG